MEKVITKKQHEIEMNVFDEIIKTLHKQLEKNPNGLYSMSEIIIGIERRKRQYKQDYEEQFD